MSKVQGGIAQASDYNSWVSNLNAVWGQGTGDSGYGQTELPTVTAGVTTMFGSQMVSLSSAIATAGTHQGTALTTNPPSTEFAVGNIIKIYPPNGGYDLDGIITSITSNRLAKNPSLQTTYLNVLNPSRTTAWSSSLTWAFTATFADEDHARYFFNSGGVVSLSFARSGGGVNNKNSAWTTLLNNIGRVNFSAYATGQTGSGGSPATSIGYYGMTTTQQQIFTQASTGIYADNYLSIWASSQTINGVRGAKGSVLVFYVQAVDGHSDAFYSVDGTFSFAAHLTSSSVLTISNPSLVTTQFTGS